MRFPLISYPLNPTFYTLKTLGDTPNPIVSCRKSFWIFFQCLRHIMHFVHLLLRNTAPRTVILSEKIFEKIFEIEESRLSHHDTQISNLSLLLKFPPNPNGNSRKSCCIFCLCLTAHEAFSTDYLSSKLSLPQKKQP